MKNFKLFLKNSLSAALLSFAVALTLVYGVTFAWAQNAGGTGGTVNNNPSGYAPLSSAGPSQPGTVFSGAPGGNGLTIGGVTIGLPTNVTVGGVQFSFGNDYEGLFENAACNVLGLSRGRFAALVMVVSGLIAICSAAIGSYRLALGTLIVGIGSQILETVVERFFGAMCPWLTIGIGG